MLEEFGLTAALEWHLEKVQRQTGLLCAFEADPEKLKVEPFVAAQIFAIAEEIIAARAQAGGRSLLVRLLRQDHAVALIFEDGGRERRLSPEICARVRLLGGEIELNGGDRLIAVALPLKLTD